MPLSINPLGLIPLGCGLVAFQQFFKLPISQTEEAETRNAQAKNRLLLLVIAGLLVIFGLYETLRPMVAPGLPSRISASGRAKENIRVMPAR